MLSSAKVNGLLLASAVKRIMGGVSDQNPAQSPSRLMPQSWSEPQAKQRPQSVVLAPQALGLSAAHKQPVVAFLSLLETQFFGHRFCLQMRVPE